MAPKYDSPVSKEDFANLLKYSLPLFERKENGQDQENQEISDLVNKELREKNDGEGKTKPPNSANQGSGIYSPTVPLYPYSSLVGAYLGRRAEAMHDFSDRVPGKHLNTFPSSGNEGLYGFTFLGDVHAWRRDDLTGSKRGKETDIHECIHTSDEYETRVLTSWIMAKETTKYIK